MKIWLSNHGLQVRGVGVMALALAFTLVACSSATAAPNETVYQSSKSTIPSSAFSDHTGITRSSVAIGNVSTLSGGLFKGALVGTEAYAAFVNSQGGIGGRKLVVDSYDDQFQGAGNKQGTQAAVQKDFATVGNFSVEDSFGGTVLKANPQVPNVSQTLDAQTSALPNSFSPNPAAGGYQLGPLVYFKKKFASDVLHTGALIAAYGAAGTVWAGEKSAMEHLGYKVVYDPTYPVTQTDFSQNVIAMKHAGVKILFIGQMPANYASAVVKALNQQNFHPALVIGASTYSEALVPESGGPAAINGTYLSQPTVLYLGEDSNAIPAVDTFLKWVQKVSPGFKADYYTLAGWLSTELFSDALKKAGANPSRGSVLQQLHNITAFSGGNLVATSDPAAKKPSNCYVLSKIEHGAFIRVDDPATSGSTHGYRCDQPYFYPPK
jgi:ABC-type branched-subunit amino acid transport system substrate-binding protein